MGQNGNDGDHYEYELNKSTGDVEKRFKALAEATNEYEMFCIVRDMYKNDDWLIMNGQCLWILRSMEDSFKHHFERLTHGE